jgi:hypothetical protein
MKAKVILPFRDKQTGKEHKPGTVIEITAQRFNEIRNKGRYIEAYEETASVKPEPKKDEKKN